MSQAKCGRTVYVVTCEGRPLCLHRNGRFYYNGYITFFETLGAAKKAINATVDACLQAKAERPGCEVAPLDRVASYDIRHARMEEGASM